MTTTNTMTDAYDWKTYVLLAIGGVLAIGSQTIDDGTTSTAVMIAGLATLTGSALWADFLDEGDLLEPDVDRRELLVNGVLLVGIVLLLVVAGMQSFPDWLRISGGAVGAVATLGTGHWKRRRQRIDVFDERETRIRYRAAYNAFLVVCGLVFAGMVAVYAATGTGALGTAVVLGCGSILGVGAITLKFSEGWYRTRM